MPLIYANPARHRTAKSGLARKTGSGSAAAKRAGGKRSLKRWGSIGQTSSKRTASGGVAASKKKRKKNPMARTRRRKLSGAAAASHKKKQARKRRTKKSRAAARPRKAARRRKPAARTRPRKAARKSARTAPRRRRVRHLTGRERAARKRAMTAIRGLEARGRNRARFKKRWKAGKVYGPVPNPRRRRRRRNPTPSTQRSILRARRAIRNRWRSPLAAATISRYKMHSNPSSVKGFLAMLLPVGVTLYGVRAISNKLVGRIPGVSYVPAQYRGVAFAALFLGAAHFATKKVRALTKFRTGAMLGAGINLVDEVIGALAPASVKARLGVGDIYDMGLGEYAQVGDYLQAAGSPINDDIALSDYVSINGVEEDLGGLEQELGLEAELGDSLSRAYLGGTSRSSMLKQIGSRSMLAPVPDRSFTKAIGPAGSNFDDDSIYAGIFQSGF